MLGKVLGGQEQPAIAIQAILLLQDVVHTREVRHICTHMLSTAMTHFRPQTFRERPGVPSINPLQKWTMLAEYQDSGEECRL
ncbi:hypothetical protein PHLCEN_2v1797 [Hermanssonia centrifuga]|uniref:Uncharacterized protein n=1 Tax=Hermanssonia centrifuga TaxID=98765 RepID=A0A2R6RW06_9APHY|nr:hypothetical protein PHLCEN_2v1797 [Hermanssonia centrifuga]